MGKIKKIMAASFVTVPCSLLHNSNLSAAERGFLVTLLSMPDDWEFSVEGLADQVPDDTSEIEKIICSLEAKGYLFTDSEGLHICIDPEKEGNK